MLEAVIGSSTYVLSTSDEEEEYFKGYRDNTIGYEQTFESPYGIKKLLYADWAASGRLYRPIEAKLAGEFGPFVGNTHSHSNMTGTTMTDAYEEAKRIIKKHVNAGPEDILLFAGTGMTGAVNKLQRLLGLKVPDKFKAACRMADADRPVIFVTHMEHHSNQISWAETIGDVVCIPPGRDSSVDPENLERMLRLFRQRRQKIGAFTACSNVTGFRTPYHRLARKMHEHGGIAVVDFSANAPYADIDMHPGSPLESLDAILFSPHKCLGGPGTSGVLVLNAALCVNSVPDQPGGGTVSWTNPWGDYRYWANAEAREEGGTPGVMQAIRTALCLKLKERMGTARMQRREQRLTDLLLRELESVPGVRILGGSSRERLGIVSFTAESVHYNLMVKLLNDRFGIQARGGCSCAGPYGHFLLGIGKGDSEKIAKQIETGDMSAKPGWVRLSLHPMMTDREITYIGAAVRSIMDNIALWKQDYIYEPKCNEWSHLGKKKPLALCEWFEFER
ncbi:aminotransferase class V-fold PLP-dependent enzyme [Paenibacillus puldeungensis]|uniref:Aminotransferase class V-fold PLP-dependent enzyme n=1 Tax=Paenibacillus puldeungensis TaxID=696536 RepID=A0ABW3RZM5_9BACL